MRIREDLCFRNGMWKKKPQRSELLVLKCFPGLPSMKQRLFAVY